jgi:hypothetical protein
LFDGEAEALSRKAIELALSGDAAALRLCLDRTTRTISKCGYGGWRSGRRRAARIIRASMPGTVDLLFDLRLCRCQPARNATVGPADGLKANSRDAAGVTRMRSFHTTVKNGHWPEHGSTVSVSVRHLWQAGDLMCASFELLDDALDAVSGCGIESKNGNSNHAPMVAEALCAMGRPDAVMPWLARYRERMLPRPARYETISVGNWRSVLGRRDRFADWAIFFSNELQAMPWRKALDHWVGRLAPGFSAAATHGVIRVGHAVRGLAAAETPTRLRELADALASWAATYHGLPTSDLATHRPMTPREAIRKVPIIAPAQRRNLGNITASFAMLDDLPEFAPVIGLIDVAGEIDQVLSELTELFACVFLANAHDRLTAIVFIHGVTSLAALGNIAPAVSEATIRAMLRYAWQTGCALYSCFGRETALDQTVEAPERDDSRVIADAIVNGDEHVIKFTEACLRRLRVDPSPTYYAAIDHACRLIPQR